MRIDLALGAPTAMIPALCPMGQIELCFAHLMKVNCSPYKSYYSRARSNGRFVILDNGIMEVGRAEGADVLLGLAAELRPNLVTPPEILHEGGSTLRLTREFVERFEQAGLFPATQILGVAHGANLRSWQRCFEELVGLPYVARIGIPYDLAFDVRSTAPAGANRLAVLATRRIEICEWIADTHRDIAVHLFGLAHPSELAGHSRHEFVKSIDTSLPIMAAAEGIRYEVDDAGPYAKRVLDITMPHDEKIVSLARHNVSVMTRWLTRV